MRVVGGSLKDRIQDRCAVVLNGEAASYDEFIVIGCKDGITNLVVNADALTMGQAVQMLSHKFDDAFTKLGNQEQMDILSILRGDEI